ncbi:MAG: VCBS repeat-containing protein, partial [Methylobacterium sp.]|uniref:FG-GAP repeat domain-containing protein n=1 Tax=Methylobacterium sp. TaxID=409 RepID=UPI00271C9796
EYRTERESYSKVISYGNAGNGASWFKVWSKSGQVMEYGNTADSKIEAIKAAGSTASWPATTVRHWALNKLSDRKGNYFTVSYTEDQVNGDYYPQRIDYTGNSNTNTAPMNSVVFEYEARPDVVPAYQMGGVNKDIKRLKRIKIFVGDTILKSYLLSYESGSNTQRSRVISAKECSGIGVCLFSAEFFYDVANIGFDQRNASSFLETHFSGYQLIPADINGDGKLDLMYITDGSMGVPYGKGMQRSVFLGNGDGTFGLRMTSSFSDTHFSGYELVTGDFNGDGKLDLMYVTDGSMGLPYGKGMQRSVFLGNGDGTFGPRIASSFLETHFSGYQLIPADINGDGKLDLMYITDGSMGVPYGKGMQRSVFLANPQLDMPDVLSSIAMNADKNIRLSIKPLTDSSTYTKDISPNASVYPKLDVQAPIYVVSSVSQTNGVGGTTTTTYKYGGL